jgi:hypothetical protein
MVVKLLEVLPFFYAYFRGKHMTTLTLTRPIDQEISSPFEAIQQLIPLCTPVERLKVASSASLSAGEEFSEIKADCGKPKNFKEKLSELGLTLKEVNKHEKAYQKLNGFRHLILGLGASAMFALTAPRMEPVLQHIIEVNEPVDQEMFEALKKELIPAPQKKAKLNGVEWEASPGGGNRSLRIAGAIPDSENARWLNEKFEANNGQIYAVVSEFIQTEHELLSLKSEVAAIAPSPEIAIAQTTASLPEIAIANPPASLPSDAIATTAQCPMPDTQCPIPTLIAVGDRVVVTEQDRGYFTHQGVVVAPIALIATPEINAWEVQLDGSCDTLFFKSNQLAPLTLFDMERQDSPVIAKDCEPMSLLQIEAAGGDIEEFIGLEVSVRTMEGKPKFNGILAKFDEKNYFVKVTTEEGDRICDLRETWVS